MSEAKAAIMEQFGFDDPQADAIVKLQLGRLAGLETVSYTHRDVYKRQEYYNKFNIDLEVLSLFYGRKDLKT